MQDSLHGYSRPRNSDARAKAERIPHAHYHSGRADHWDDGVGPASHDNRADPRNQDHNETHPEDASTTWSYNAIGRGPAGAGCRQCDICRRRRTRRVVGSPRGCKERVTCRARPPCRGRSLRCGGCSGFVTSENGESPLFPFGVGGRVRTSGRKRISKGRHAQDPAPWVLRERYAEGNDLATNGRFRLESRRDAGRPRLRSRVVDGSRE
jgi:hypothetical protein